MSTTADENMTAQKDSMEIWSKEQRGCEKQDAEMQGGRRCAGSRAGGLSVCRWVH